MHSQTFAVLGNRHKLRVSSNEKGPAQGRASSVRISKFAQANWLALARFVSHAFSAAARLCSAVFPLTIFAIVSGEYLRPVAAALCLRRVSSEVTAPHRVPGLPSIAAATFATWSELFTLPFNAALAFALLSGVDRLRLANSDIFALDSAL